MVLKFDCSEKHLDSILSKILFKICWGHFLYLFFQEFYLFKEKHYNFYITILWKFRFLQVYSLSPKHKSFHSLVNISTSLEKPRVPYQSASQDSEI